MRPAPRPLIVAAPDLLAGIRVEGLDARGQLPPLLRPGMLADRVSYRRWEEFAAEELACGAGTAEARLARVARVTDAVCEWTPAAGLSLTDHLEHRIGESERAVHESWRMEPGQALALYGDVRSSCPSVLAPHPAPGELHAWLERWVDPEWDAWAPVIGRYLAAKVFASWLAYQGSGLRTVLAGAFSALAVLRIEAARQCARAARRLDAGLLKEAIRQADLLLLHLASREEMADKMGTS